MEINLDLQRYVEWNVGNIIPIKDKFGYRVTLTYMDGTTREQQKSGFSTQKEASAARDETVGELYAGKYVVYSNVKVRDFLRHWLDEDILKRVKSETTYTTYRNIVYNHITPFLGGWNMADVNRAMIQQLYFDRAAYSINIAKQTKTVMNTSFGYAAAKKIIPLNPCTGIDLPKNVPRGEYHIRRIDTTRTLTIEQVLLLLEKSRETKIHMMILFNVLMGLRRGEIIGVKYSDVDYINRTLSVTRQLGKKLNSKKEDVAPRMFTKQELTPKTPSSKRTIPIPDYVFEAILEQRAIYEKNRSRRRTAFQDLDYICCSSYGRPRSHDFHWPHYKRLLRDCGLPDIRWHDLRATFTTILLKEEFNPKAIARLLGHAKEIVTIDVYGDKRRIIEDCVDEITPFIEEVLPLEDVPVVDLNDDSVMIDVCEYIET